MAAFVAVVAVMLASALVLAIVLPFLRAADEQGAL